MKHVLKILCLWLCIPFSGHAQTQDHAGEDKLVCAGGTTQLGPTTPCTDCCYKWSPGTNLDDPNVANPTVSGINESRLYSVTVSLPNGNYEVDYVTVYVYSIDVAIFKPRFLSGNPNVGEQQVPESLEETIGAQTMVNIDNDDCDAAFDNQDNLISGGDDEFVKIKISMSVDLPGFTSAPPGTAGRLTAIEYKAALVLQSGSSVGLRFWLSNDKSAGVYQLGDEITLTPVGSNLYEGSIWVEGLEGHTVQRQSKFAARASQNGEPVACGTEDVVALTVIGVKDIQWVGMENGYTGDGKNNNNTLDVVTNIPAKAQRVFPESKISGTEDAPSTTPAKSTVRASIDLTVAPVEPLPLYLRTFDVDDPSDETKFIDPNDLGTSGTYEGGVGLTYDLNEDNRGKVSTSSTADPNNPGSGSSKAGYFSGTGVTTVDAPNGIYRKTALSGQANVSATFEVARYPGDNYRFAVYGDLDFIKKMRNRDQFDKHAIKDECTGDLPNCKEIDLQYESPILQVWRTLHIEHDMMRRAIETPNNENRDIRGAYFTDFVLHSSGKLEQILNVTGGLPLNDGSSGAQRLQNGSTKIGNLSPLIRSILLTTGQNVYFVTPGRVSFAGLSCLIKKSGQPDLNATITSITKPGIPTYLVKIDPIANLDSYSGGTVYLGGSSDVSGTMTAIPSSTTSFALSSIKVPVWLKDDDLIDILPHDPSEGSRTIVKDAYKAALIDAVFDGGGYTSYNRNDLPFVINAPLVSDPYYTTDANSKAMESSNYWIVNLVLAWQLITDVDADPNSEPLVVEGATTGDLPEHCKVNPGGNISIIATETIRDFEYPDGNFEQKVGVVMTHEIGHQLGLTHGFFSTPTTDCASCIEDCNMVGLMTANPTNNSLSFI